MTFARNCVIITIRCAPYDFILKKGMIAMSKKENFELNENNLDMVSGGAGGNNAPIDTANLKLRKRKKPVTPGKPLTDKDISDLDRFVGLH